METSQTPMTAIPVAKTTSDTHNYKGWLNSDKFYKRALAVLGYSFIGQLLLILIIVLISMAFGTVAGLASFVF